MKIKSIAVRIWLVFTLTITIIISLISAIYSYGYYYLNEYNQKNALLFAHNVFKNNSQGKIEFEDFKNLRDSRHFFVNINETDKQIVHIGRDFLLDNPPIENLQNKEISPMSNLEKYNKDLELEQKILTFASEEMNENFIRTSINNTKYFIVISSIDSGYFISYMPIYRDYRMLIYFSLLGLLFIIGGTLATRFISKSITKPLSELSDFTKRIAKKDFSTTININTQDEVGNLAQAMLKMQEALKQVDKEEKQFLQSMSHDLKTPVAVIIAHADSIIDGVYINSVEHTAEIIKNEAIRLNKKIKGLLYYNTLEFSLKNQENIEQINLKDFLFDMTSRFKFLNPSLTWELALEDLSINADYEKLTISIENIIDNAIRYAKTKIKIELLEKDEQIVINIFNDGEKIQENAINKIFNNLYKDKKGNFGLGLAISKKIINHYNGFITAKNVDNGVNFELKFPK